MAAAGLGLPGEAPYDPLINQASAQWGVPAGLLAAQLSVESSFRANAVSPAGARGIAQFMPQTARVYGVDVTSPASSIQGEAHYLHDLFGTTGSWDAALENYSGNTPGYAAKVDAIWHGSGSAAGTGGTSPAAGTSTNSPTSGTADVAGTVTGWLDSVAIRVGCCLFGAALVLLGLHKMTAGNG